jgi:hypothetical protein
LFIVCGKCFSSPQWVFVPVPSRSPRVIVGYILYFMLNYFQKVGHRMRSKFRYKNDFWGEKKYCVTVVMHTTSLPLMSTDVNFNPRTRRWSASKYGMDFVCVATAIHSKTVLFNQLVNAVI